MPAPEPLTLVYDRTRGTKLDAYIPPDGDGTARAAIVVFHGGGIVGGSRKDAFFPDYLITEPLARGWIVVSADYRLLHPSTGQDIIDDARAVFAYLADPASELATALSTAGVPLALDRLAVCGISGGNYPARAAGTLPSIVPRPRAYLDMCGQGGDWLSDHWIQNKDGPPAWAAGIVFDKQKLQALLAAGGGDVVSEDANWPDPATGLVTSPHGRGMFLVHFYQTGTYIDYVLSMPGLSAKLRELPYDRRLAGVPEDKRGLLLPMSSESAPVFAVHGVLDDMALLGEGQATIAEAQRLGVQNGHHWAEGAGHAGMMATPPGVHPAWMAGVKQAFDFAAQHIG